MEPLSLSTYAIVKWGLRVGLKWNQIRLLIAELDRFAAAHAVSRRQTLEWLGAARNAPGGRIFIAGDGEILRVANPKVRTIAQRALINQYKWPDSPRLNDWLDSYPGSPS